MACGRRLVVERIAVRWVDNLEKVVVCKQTLVVQHVVVLEVVMGIAFVEGVLVDLVAV